jgi:hypothetical protein
MVSNEDPGIYQSIDLPVVLEHEGTHQTDEDYKEFFNDMGMNFQWTQP